MFDGEEFEVCYLYCCYCMLGPTLSARLFRI